MLAGAHARKTLGGLEPRPPVMRKPFRPACRDVFPASDRLVRTAGHVKLRGEVPRILRRSLGPRSGRKAQVSEPIPFTQVDVLLSFRDRVPASRGQGGWSRSMFLGPGFLHCPGIPCRGRLWRNDEMCVCVCSKPCSRPLFGSATPPSGPRGIPSMPATP